MILLDGEDYENLEVLNKVHIRKIQVEIMRIWKRSGEMILVVVVMIMMMMMMMVMLMMIIIMLMMMIIMLMKMRMRMVCCRDSFLYITISNIILLSSLLGPAFKMSEDHNARREKLRRAKMYEKAAILV
jgi:hypothetical protein